MGTHPWLPSATSVGKTSKVGNLIRKEPAHLRPQKKGERNVEDIGNHSQKRLRIGKILFHARNNKKEVGKSAV